jgi:hypoxanthine phosphoribosyltransferase
MTREVMTYADFGDSIRDLAASISDSGFQADWIVAIARGGLIVGGALGYALGVKNIATINVEFYTGIGERRDVPVELPPLLDPELLATQRILVADDVADSGGTLDLVASKLRTSVAELRTAVLYRKSTSSVACEYVWRNTDLWIDFPWSSAPAVQP